MLAVKAACLSVNTPWDSTTRKPSSDDEHRRRARYRYYSYRPERRSEMIREEATEVILEAKKEKELTFEAIGQKVGAHKVWTTAALLGQHPMSPEQADTVVDLLDLDEEVGRALQEIPLRGALDQDVPTDPTIYRIHEVTQVYGTTIKALINEEFGDGIMSAITFHMDIEREETDSGPRVKITYNGKFLPYSWE